MEKIIEKYKNALFALYGERLKQTSNGVHCSYCGKLIDGEYCDCQKAKKVNRFYKKVIRKRNEIVSALDCCGDVEVVKKAYCPKLPSKFEGLGFEDYKTTEKSQEQALNSVKDYFENGIANFITGKNLILFGNYGTGKTMLMSILCESLVDKYLFACRYINAVDLMNEIKNTFNDKTETFKTVLNRYKKADFLFLDDVDKCKSTEFLNEIFYAITNYRTENELPTVISANHNPDELDSQFFGEAIVSRLININEATLVEFKHKNYRLEGV